jgi:hypothetical protein
LRFEGPLPSKLALWRYLRMEEVGAELDLDRELLA